VLVRARAGLHACFARKDHASSSVAPAAAAKHTTLRRLYPLRAYPDTQVPGRASITPATLVQLKADDLAQHSTIVTARKSTTLCGTVILGRSRETRLVGAVDFGFEEEGGSEDQHV
jgi:hypothetical protein